MLYYLIRPLLPARIVLLKRCFTTSVSAARKGVVTPPDAQRYHLGNRVWQLSRQPGKWSLLQGLRVRITGVITLFRDEKDLQAWRAMYVPF